MKDEFIGEGALAGQIVRMEFGYCNVRMRTLRVDKKVMMDALHRNIRFQTCS